MALLIEVLESGPLDINAMVSLRIKVEEMNEAFRAMEKAEVIRGAILEVGRNRSHRWHRTRGTAHFV